jgi:endoglucanase
MNHLTSRLARPMMAALLAGAAVTAVLATGRPVPAVQAAAAPGDRARVDPAWEVWQVPQAADPTNPDNPLADRLWGVYDGPQDQVWSPYRAATGTRKELIGKIALRPRTKWYGSFVPDAGIESTVRKYIAASQDGDPSRLVQMAIFRLKPWEHTGCTRPATAAETASYRRWISNLATGIGSTPTLVVMQPDGPFLWCVPRRAATARQLAWATRTLSALPQTSVYIDAGAADWCENGKGNDPERCAAILKRTGVQYARGFALDSTHYNGPIENVLHGARIVDILRRDGYGAKHFIVDTAKSGRPMRWSEVIPSRPGGLKDDARTCRTPTMTRCVTLGIPPTAQPADPRWGLPAQVQQLAAAEVDGFVWFGRPWLYRQADPFVARRALNMARTTPWPGPRYDAPPS